MDRNLALDLVRVTEAAALSAARYLGRGDKNIADAAAVDSMRRMFDTIDMDGVVVIGEGEMDEAPMLYIGEKIGNKTQSAIKVDIAVDPLDGTNCVAKGLPNSIAVVALAPRGHLLNAPDMYMEKIAVGPKARGHISLDFPLKANLSILSRALDKSFDDLTVTILDRPRHECLIKECRDAGVRIKLFTDGDISAAMATCFEHSGVDMMIGIGGAPEGVLAAAAIKCMGGDFQGRLAPQNDQEKKRCIDMGLDYNKLLTLDDLVKGDEVYFAATGVSDGDFLKGVVYKPNKIAITDSLVMRSETGTIRFIKAIHRLDKKPIY
ncbi:fructose-1,6-bisphosphatase II [Alkalithermobacter thermoalcaliphilus JW-YL-7 = DSM 7308]|uniref:Fructose-1,6-bisphosphatase n=1 Tax=Alkalithermobacter thermoalcaliphilus JW-YL-7 = DSM 7308 TaxID=1121328 RepID=A0A150FTN9_CLOPD|nr:fructose-1,6-bisphosphatase, class II [[Clostridium] paradoxum JW-YL-7 = DSM 7308]SHK71164.1 fructose-1,6-bisphosphatase II [[Clostridium] paradoxum JW-YL-7 = DSM 7308]